MGSRLPSPPALPLSLTAGLPCHVTVSTVNVVKILIKSTAPAQYLATSNNRKRHKLSPSPTLISRALDAGLANGKQTLAELSTWQTKQQRKLIQASVLCVASSLPRTGVRLKLLSYNLCVSPATTN